jgi:hypothetical protein
MFAARHLLTLASRLRGGLAVALVYLFVLQGLLAPGASLTARPEAGTAAMILCDGAMDGSTDAPGIPAGGHDLCCALGCLPGSVSLVGLGLATGVRLPAWTPLVEVATPAEPSADPTGPPREWRPGSSGPRAPPSPIA